MASQTGSVVSVDEEKIRGHVDEVVRSSVEETLNGLLNAEADSLCGAKRYERTANRVDTRAGSYDRKLQTKACEFNIKVPRLRSLPFETQIIERCGLSTAEKNRSCCRLNWLRVSCIRFLYHKMIA